MNAPVPDLRPGDAFDWCGRRVELVAWEWYRRYGARPGRYLTVRDNDGHEHRLHYFADEWVTLA